MRVPCDIETEADLIRYYSHGWMGLNGIKDGKVLPFSPRTNQHGLITGTLLNEELRTDVYGIRWSDLLIQGSFGRPDLGMLHNGPTVVFAAHKAVRNSARGHRNDKTTFHDFNMWDCREQLKGHLPCRSATRYDLIWEVFNPRYEPLDKAIKILEDGEGAGVPISRNYALYVNKDSKHPLLAYKRWTIGFVPRAKSAILDENYREYAEDIEKNTGMEISFVH
jgi:hypothetical protein